jgi:hypothetical protein
VLAACGGNDNKSSTTTTTAASATTTSTAAGAAQQARDAVAEARARKLVLVQADMPPGWAAEAAKPDTPEETATSNELSACAGLSADADDAANVNGDTFSMGPTTQVMSSADIVREERRYREDLLAVKGSKLQPCLQDFLTKSIGRELGNAPTGVEFTPLTVPSFGDSTVGYRLKANVTASGVALTLYFDLVLMAKDRAEVSATFLNIGQPFDNVLETSLLNKLGTKLNGTP